MSGLSPTQVQLGCRRTAPGRGTYYYDVILCQHQLVYELWFDETNYEWSTDPLGQQPHYARLMDSMRATAAAIAPELRR